MLTQVYTRLVSQTGNTRDVDNSILARKIIPESAIVIDFDRVQKKKPALGKYRSIKSLVNGWQMALKSRVSERC